MKGNVKLCGLLIILFFCLINSQVLAQTDYPDNEEGQYEDMLTPQYYNTLEGGYFRTEVNKFVHFARLLPFQHPIESPEGEIPDYTIGRSFGDGIGPGGKGSHHPAIDYYINNTSSVNLYAACDGYVTIDSSVNRYRHFLSISSDVKDSSETVLGKMVIIYAHIDLDLDAAENIKPEGKFVKKGDLISKNLYSGTVGGPHLHFEIRYYRTTDAGDEDFYGGKVGEKTSPSTGSWTYGYWNPDAGYGFAHPFNHIYQGVSSSSSYYYSDDIKFYPNPVKNVLSVISKKAFNDEILTICTLLGEEIYKSPLPKESKSATIDLSDFKKGFYLVVIGNSDSSKTTKIVKE